MALPPSMQSGLLAPEDVFLTENPYSGLFAEPANNFMFLPLAKTESGRFRPAVPQFVQGMYEASIGDEGVGGVAADIGRSIFGGEPVSGDRMFDAALRYGAEVMAPQSAASLAMRPSPNTLLAGGYYGGLLDEVSPDTIKRMLDVAEGKYIDPVRETVDKRGATSRFTDLGGSVPSDRPYTSMTSVQTDVAGLQPIKEVDIQDLVGKELIFAPADRTSINRMVESVDGIPLSEPLLTEGGVYYPRLLSNWASGVSPMGALKNRQNQVLKSGREPVISTLLMGARSDIYSAQTSQIAKRAIDNAKIAKKDIQAFDELIRKTYPDWKGIRSKKAEEQLLNDPVLRTIFVDKLRGKAAQKAGFPDMSSIRKASTQEEFLGLPDTLSGQSLLSAPTRIEGMKPSTHTTYGLTFDNPDMSYMGRLGLGKLPMEISMPTILAKRRKEGKPIGSDQRAVTMPTVFVREPVTNQYADRVSQFIEEGKNIGILY